MNMNKQYNINRRVHLARQSGFTMVELMIVITILGILAAAYFFLGDTSKSKATALLTSMQETSNAMVRMKTDTGCFTRRIDGLFDKTQNTAANTFCGQDTRPTWSGPYIQPFQLDASNNMLINNVSAGVTIQVQRENSGIGRTYFLRASNVPNEIIRKYIQVCNGTDSEAAIPTAFTNVKCRGALGTGTTETGTVDLIVDQVTS